MATAVEYGLIAAGISIAIITAVNGVDIKPTSVMDDKIAEKNAAAACAVLPGTTNVVISGWHGSKLEYKCSNWPKFTYPTFVRYR